MGDVGGLAMGVWQRFYFCCDLFLEDSLFHHIYLFRCLPNAKTGRRLSKEDLDCIRSTHIPAQIFSVDLEGVLRCEVMKHHPVAFCPTPLLSMEVFIFFLLKQYRFYCIYGSLFF